MSSGRALDTKIVEKVWGRDALPAPFSAPPGERIGEIWFDPPHELPELLVKYLFTSEKLSVQVHPSDGTAPSGSRGKDECWLVLSAEPGAKLAVGFRDEISPEAMRNASLDGSIEDLLAWYSVAAGDFIYLPAGTVHAIGAGLTLIEIQQNSDVTYRLFDYGRPRELHLDAAIAVADGAPHPAQFRRRVPETSCVSLVDGPQFRLDRIEGAPDSSIASRYGGRPLLIVPIDASVMVGDVGIAPGACGFSRDIAQVLWPKEGHALIAQPL